MPLRSSVQASGPLGDFQAFVAGATGGTGQAIVRRLVAEGVPVRALVRDIGRAVSQHHLLLSACHIALLSGGGTLVSVCFCLVMPWRAVQKFRQVFRHHEPCFYVLLYMQASVLPPQVELVRGDVYQFSTLERAVADSNVMFIATGSRPALDPFGPFNIDYQASRAPDMQKASFTTTSHAMHVQCL